VATDDEIELPFWTNLEKDDILIFGKPPEQTDSDHKNGIARFGGPWRAPS
jgi:hypothetical protein